MNVSVQVPNDSIPWKTLKAIAQTVDRGRWHTLWNYDHLVPPAAELLPHLTDDRARYEEGDTLEGWSMLAAWAALTERVRLGTLVTATPFRNPALLAKMAATVDHVSDGRLELGLGAAWHTSEARAYGIALGSAKERLDRFEEALEVIHRLLTPGPRRSFQGQYFTLDDAPFAPQPVQARVPILIGGGGEKRTLRLVAKYADNYNFFGNVLSDRDTYRRKNDLLDEHCLAIGRNPGEIRRSIVFWANLVDDDARARAQRDFLGQHLDDKGRDAILFGSPRYVLDGVHRVIDGLPVDEVIFCGLSSEPEMFQRFDEEILTHLTPVAVA